MEKRLEFAIDLLVKESRKILAAFEKFENLPPEKRLRDPLAALTLEKMHAANFFENVRNWHKRLEALHAEVRIALNDSTVADRVDEFLNAMRALAEERSEKLIATQFVDEAQRELEMRN